MNTEKVKKELNTGNKQERQLQKKIRDLHEKIKYLEIKKQKEIEEREIQKKNTSVITIVFLVVSLLIV